MTYNITPHKPLSVQTGAALRFCVSISKDGAYQFVLGTYIGWEGAALSLPALLETDNPP